MGKCRGFLLFCSTNYVVIKFYIDFIALNISTERKKWYSKYKNKFEKGALLSTLDDVTYPRRATSPKTEVSGVALKILICSKIKSPTMGRYCAFFLVHTSVCTLKCHSLQNWYYFYQNRCILTTFEIRHVHVKCRNAYKTSFKW